MTINRKCSSCLKLIILLLSVSSSHILPAQSKDSTNSRLINSFTGVVTVQTKGISTIPNLTLGKPAAIFDLKIGRKLTFEPQFRFALKGKPWAMVFWWRYNAANTGRFRLNLSANHSLSYRTINVTSAGTSQEIIRTTRYLAGAIAPVFQINRYLDAGAYLFYTYGIEKFITRNTFMVSFRPAVNIPITKNIVGRISPEVYHLTMDDNDGVFFNGSFSITKKNFPLSISGLINKPMRSNIPSEYDLLWNVGLSYTFNKKYVEAN